MIERRASVIALRMQATGIPLLMINLRTAKESARDFAIGCRSRPRSVIR